MAKEVRLLSLLLENFKGAKRVELTPDGGNAAAYGVNGTGKTTLFDAFKWLTTGKDSTGKADFEVKTLTKAGEVLHNLEHKVEGVFEVDGRKLTLTRVFIEKWTQKRGSATSEFSGHTTQYFVNGVPCKESEFQAKVAQIADESTMQLLTDPEYFNGVLHWTKRRAVLLEIAGGNVTDEEVFSANKALRDLPEILDGRTAAEHKKMVTAKRKAINDELDKLPTRIDEANQSLPDEGRSEKDIRADIARVAQQRDERKAELSGGDTGAALVEAQKARNVIEGKMQERQRQIRQAIDEKAQAEQAKLTAASDKVAEAERTVRNLKRTIADGEEEAQRLTTKRERLLKDYHTAEALTFAFEQNENCPTCGQPLPQERLQAARDKALADFNAEKSRKMETAKADGTPLKAAIQEATAAVEQAKAKLPEAEKAKADAEREVAEIRQRIANLRAQAPDPEKDVEYQNLQQDLTGAEQEIASIKSGNAVARQMVAEAVRGYDEQLTTLNTELARVDQRKTGLERIAELGKREKALTAEYERLEHELNLCEEFTRAQARMLEERVNGMFVYASFRLFKDQINGGLEDTCECMLDGVPYGNMSHGEKIKVGLDIISVLSRHYGMTAPIWVDFAESYTGPLPTDTQVIRLVVSEGDTVLRVECETAVAAD